MTASPDDPLAGDAPTVSVPAAARALGVARNSLYAAIAAGTAPVQVVRVNRSIRVSTASLRRALGLDTPAPTRANARPAPQQIP